jgi:D-tyrosyl-tRNA(Tyr) deacylase
MRAVLQRVTRAEVRVGAERVARIERGLLAYVGVAASDTAADAEWLARKVAELRLFPTAEAPRPRPLSQGSKEEPRTGAPSPPTLPPEGEGSRTPAGERSMERSVVEAGGAVLLVSQFTLLADTRRGRRPSFTAAARPELAVPLLDALASALRSRGIKVATGRFGAHMQVECVNDGPVTIVLDSAAR